MPLYEFECENCKRVIEELRRVGDFSPPVCVCGVLMNKKLNTVGIVLSGYGWMTGSQEKLKKRAEEQGKKFFRKHDNLQRLSQWYVRRNEREG